MDEMDRINARSRRKSKIIISFFLIIILALSLNTISSINWKGPESDSPEAPIPLRITYNSHAPIFINGDSQFNNTMFPSNGVVSGNGTPGNPYIIDGWEINASTANGIRTQNTNSHFIIRNCYVYGGSVVYNGIDLINSSNGLLMDNNLSRNRFGIGLESSDEVAIINNTFFMNIAMSISLVSSDNCTISDNYCSIGYRGISLITSNNNTIGNNTCRIQSDYGIYLEKSNGNDLIGNECLDNDYGIYVYWSSNYTIQSNNCSRNLLGVYLYLSGYSGINILKNNSILNSTLYGMFISSSKDNAIMNNTLVSNNLYGMYIAWSPNNTITCNRIQNTSGLGAYLDSTSSCNTLWNNTYIGNNGAGSTYNLSHIQARDDGIDNWWNSTRGYGNWWSDWRAPDDDWDGIVDNPYNISGSAGAKDYYPQTVPGTPIPEPTTIILVGIMMMIFLMIGKTNKRR